MPSLKGRLPPGQYVTSEFPMTLPPSGLPHFIPETWDLRVFGLVDSALTLAHADFLALPRVAVTADLHSVDTWSVLDNRWEGVLARELMARAHPRPEARFVLVHADGGLSTCLPLADLLRTDVVLADRRNGQPLHPGLGYPARLVVPHRYSYKSAKWVRAFEVLSEEQPGYWELRGYSRTADPWTDDRFATV